MFPYCLTIQHLNDNKRQGKRADIWRVKEIAIREREDRE